MILINQRQLTVGLGMHRRGGGAIGSGPVRYDGGEYLPEGKHPGAAIGAPWRPLLPIILSGEYIIIRQSAHLRLYTPLKFPSSDLNRSSSDGCAPLPPNKNASVRSPKSLNYFFNSRQFLSWRSVTIPSSKNQSLALNNIQIHVIHSQCKTIRQFLFKQQNITKLFFSNLNPAR